MDRFVQLYGSLGPNGQRTAFTGTTRFRLTNCRVSGWDTGYQAVDSAWIDTDGTIFADDHVGLCFNSADTPMVFDNFYTGNETDIDDRCGQPLDISEAVFE